MMRLFLLIFIFVSFIQSSFSALVEVGTLAAKPFYSINIGDDVRYVQVSVNGLDLFNKNGVLAVGNPGISVYCAGEPGVANLMPPDFSFSVISSIIESPNNVFFIYNGMYNYTMIKYNKTNDTLSDPLEFSISFGCDSNIEDEPVFAVEGDNLLIGYSFSPEIVWSLPFNDNGQEINLSFYSGQAVMSSLFLSLGGYHVYNVDYNIIHFVDEGYKQYIWLAMDTGGDLIQFYDVFVSTWSFRGGKLLYNESGSKAYLSLYGVGTSPAMRGYYNYEIGSFSYVDDDYFIDVFNGELVVVHSPLTMGMNYLITEFKPIIDLINPGGIPTFYFVDTVDNTNGWTILKDTEVNLEDFLVDISDSGVVSNTGGIDESVFDWDIDGDGEVGIGEFFSGVGSTIKAFFSNLVEFFSSLKNLLEEILKLGGTDEVKTFSFIPVSYANGFAVELFGANPVVEGSFLDKIYKFIRGFTYFIFLLLCLSLIFVIRRKG